MRKSRSAHDHARGVKIGRKSALAHLSKRELTNQELADALDMMKVESDRGVAIMGAALVEKILRDIINLCLIHADDIDGLYHDQGAPFGTLSNKTKVAYALGLCDKQIARDIDSIRTIRNQFSHALRPITFDQPEISLTCKKLIRHASRFIYAQASAGIGRILLSEGQKLAQANLDRITLQFNRDMAALDKSGG